MEAFLSAATYPLPLPLLIPVLLANATFFHSLRHAVSAVGSSFARRHSSDSAKVAKFGESTFKLLCHGGFSLFGLKQITTQPWWAETRLLWTAQDAWVPPPLLHMYYLCQMAYNLEAFFYLLSHSFSLELSSLFYGLPRVTKSDARRGDFLEMMIHHVTTDLLLVLSYRHHFVRVGMVILYIHDLSDVRNSLNEI